MLFNSPEFAIFFPVATLLYFLTPPRLRWLTLLAASCVFYMAFIPIYIMILFGLILIDYMAGLLIERARGLARRRLLWVSLVSNIGVLSVFKYYNFWIENIGGIFRLFGSSPPLPMLFIVLPIGLSFHTFQAMAYTIEVYRGHVRAERHLGLFALYIMFYPQLVAGPIERPQNLLAQIRERHERERREIDPLRVVSGLKLMAWGLFKKVVISDRLAIVVNPVYQSPTMYHGPALMVASFFFAWQIYCDFSGYSDIAVGAAEVMGFRLMTNFRRPYLARSVRDFWRRWHISLSSWFRDYVYVPLGGRRVEAPRWFANLMITFVLSGLWHGAHWRFVVWGALNGLYVVMSIITADLRQRVRHSFGLDRSPRLLNVLQTGGTFVLITITWVFFRASNLGDATFVLRHMLDFQGAGLREMSVSPIQLWIAAALLLALALFERYQASDDPRVALLGAPPWLRWSVYYGLVMIIIGLGVFDRTPFIYFQF